MLVSRSQIQLNGTGIFMRYRAEIECIHDCNGTAIHAVFSDIMVILIFMIIKIATYLLGIKVEVPLRISSPHYHAGCILFQ